MPKRSRNCSGLRHPVQIRDFRCPECGYRLTCPKQMRRTGPGHVKTMWCPECQTVRDFVQLRDGEEFIFLAAASEEGGLAAAAFSAAFPQSADSGAVYQTQFSAACVPAGR